MKILLKNKIYESCEQYTDPLINAFFNLERDILVTVTVDPTVCKTQTYSNRATFRPGGPGTT